jgi:ABC-type glycerol-3-phosphate transport system substrate-binding protein
MRRLALLLVAVLALAACGSGHKKSSAESAQAQIKSAYMKFFSGKTSISDRVALLQDGPKLEQLVREFANDPLAKNVSASVSSVKLVGANLAKVVYTVKVAASSLPPQTGTAVRQNGTWKVGDAGLCRLVALGGTTPSVCKNRNF